jgi:hypothetical protein
MPRNTKILLLFCFLSQVVITQGRRFSQIEQTTLMKGCAPFQNEKQALQSNLGEKGKHPSFPLSLGFFLAAGLVPGTKQGGCSAAPVQWLTAENFWTIICYVVCSVGALSLLQSPTVD